MWKYEREQTFRTNNCLNWNQNEITLNKIKIKKKNRIKLLIKKAKETMKIDSIFWNIDSRRVRKKKPVRRGSENSIN